MTCLVAIIIGKPKKPTSIEIERGENFNKFRLTSVSSPSCHNSSNIVVVLPALVCVVDMRVVNHKRVKNK